MSAVWFVLAFVWARWIQKIEDDLPTDPVGAVLFFVLLLANPFLWLFLWSFK